jgi:hypothetical protein
MASAAEFPLGDLRHAHLGRSLGHLEILVMTVGTLEILSVHMFFVAEDDR